VDGRTNIETGFIRSTYNHIDGHLAIIYRAQSETDKQYWDSEVYFVMHCHGVITNRTEK